MSPKRKTRQEQFAKNGQSISNLKASDAITSNDANWRDAITPCPWRPLPSDGFMVMQIDNRPGLARKEKPEPAEVE